MLGGSNIGKDISSCLLIKNTGHKVNFMEFYKVLMTSADVPAEVMRGEISMIVCSLC